MSLNKSSLYLPIKQRENKFECPNCNRYNEVIFQSTYLRSTSNPFLTKSQYKELEDFPRNPTQPISPTQTKPKKKNFLPQTYSWINHNCYHDSCHYLAEKWHRLSKGVHTIIQETLPNPITNANQALSQGEQKFIKFYSYLLKFKIKII